MKAVLLYAYGDPAQLRYEETDMPKYGDNEVEWPKNSDDCEGGGTGTKIALSRRMERCNQRLTETHVFKHYTLRNWSLSGA
jgi:hypothetical protein